MDCVEYFEGHSYTESVGQPRTLKRTFKITADSPADTWFDVREDAAFPVEKFDPDPQDSDLRVSAISLDREGGVVWVVVATYSDAPEAISPLDRPAVWKISTAKHQKIITSDVNGDKIVNSAGTPYRDFAIEVSEAILSCEVYKADSFDVQGAIEALKDKVNDDSFTCPLGTFAVNSLKVENIECEQVVEDGTDYFKVRYQLAHSTELAPDSGDVIGWLPLPVLSQGVAQWNGSKAVPIIDEDTGLQITEPVLLDASGVRTDTAFYIDYYPNKTETFTGAIP